MSDGRHKIRAGFGIAVCFVLVLAGAVPQKYIPEWLYPVVRAKGRFEGNPVRLPGPKGREREAATKVWIKMGQGLCRGSLKDDTKTSLLFNMGEGRFRAQIPVGSALVLDPQGNEGEYDVTIGPEWHPLGPKVRHGVLLPMGLAYILVSVFAGRFSLQARQLGVKRLLFLVGVAVVSGLVVYPVLHEGGHMVFGMLLGATPDWKGIVWTSLGGQEPHASFSSLPEAAGPLMSAGGHILPTLAALLLLLIWRLIRRKASWYLSAGLVVVPVLNLFSSLGCVFELYQNTHMDALAVYLGLKGPLRVAIALSPLSVAVAAYIWLWRSFRRGAIISKT